MVIRTARLNTSAPPPGRLVRPASLSRCSTSRNEHLLDPGQVRDLDGRERLDVHAGIRLPQGADHVRVVAQAQLGVQPAHDVEFAGRRALGARRLRQHLVERAGVGALLLRHPREGAEHARVAQHADVGGVDVLVGGEEDALAVPARGCARRPGRRRRSGRGSRTGRARRRRRAARPPPASRRRPARPPRVPPGTARSGSAVVTGRRLSRGESLHDERHVVPAEAEGVGHGDVHPPLDGVVRGAVEVALGVRRLVVDGRRDRRRARSPARRWRTPPRRPRRAGGRSWTWSSRRPASGRASPNTAFMACVSATSPARRRGAVRVDVLRCRPRSSAAVGQGARRMARCAPRPPARAASCGTRRRSCRTRPSRLDRGAAALARARGSPAPRCRAPSPITKPSRVRSKGREACSGSSLRGESAFMLAKPAIARGVMAASAPPAIIDVGVAVLDGPVRLADGVRGRGAGRDGAEVGPRQAVAHRHQAGRHVGNEHRDEEGGDASGPLLEVDLALLLEGRDAADPAADQHAGARGRGKAIAPGRPPGPPARSPPCRTGRTGRSAWPPCAPCRPAGRSPSPRSRTGRRAAWGRNAECARPRTSRRPARSSSLPRCCRRASPARGR